MTRNLGYGDEFRSHDRFIVEKLIEFDSPTFHISNSFE